MPLRWLGMLADYLNKRLCKPDKIGVALWKKLCDSLKTRKEQFEGSDSMTLEKKRRQKFIASASLSRKSFT